MFFSDSKNIFSSIDPLFFFLSLFIGLVYTYMTAPEPHIVIKYPTPFNIRHTVYRDQLGTCYKYRIREVACPHNSAEVVKILPNTYISPKAKAHSVRD